MFYFVCFFNSIWLTSNIKIHSNTHAHLCVCVCVCGLIICYLVYVGEKSSGKSSIINAIIGEKILPTGIRATTTKVCRVKHSEELIIATCDENDKDYKDWISFDNTKQLADKLRTIATTSDTTISSVDIFMPVPFKQVYFLLNYNQ